MREDGILSSEKALSIRCFFGSLLISSANFSFSANESSRFAFVLG